MSMKTVTDGCTLMDLLYVCQETRCFEFKKKKKRLDCWLCFTVPCWRCVCVCVCFEEAGLLVMFYCSMLTLCLWLLCAADNRGRSIVLCGVWISGHCFTGNGECIELFLTAILPLLVFVTAIFILKDFISFFLFSFFLFCNKGCNEGLTSMDWFKL